MNPLSGYPPLPRHHPSEEWLLGYAAGRLAPVPALVTTTHLPFCRQCRDTVRLAETIGGVLMADMPPDTLAEDALPRALAKLDQPAGTPTLQSPTLQRPALQRSKAELAPDVPLPAALRGLRRSRWRWLAPGISRMTLDVPDADHSERAYILRVSPGKRLPEHGHDGWEATCVLAGHFDVGGGTYQAGDVLEISRSIVHQPVSGTDTTCICLIVSGGDVKPTGWLARLLQPLMGR